MKNKLLFLGAAMFATAAVSILKPIRGHMTPADLRDAPNSGFPTQQLSAIGLGTEKEIPIPKAEDASDSSDINSQAAIASRCAPPAAGEEPIYQSDFRWNYTMPEMMDRAAQMYDSPKRLEKRAYWDSASGTILLPPSYSDKPVKITPAFVNAVRRHIERALELKYADAVFFPDMGHSHILVPDELWESKYNKYPTSENSKLYEDMFSDRNLHIFYHTAEQLKLLENGQLVADEYVRFRHKYRNISGPITEDAELTVYQNPQSSANTVSEIPGYRWWGAGFNFSAQKNGCFAYRHGGKTYYFDISLLDLPMKPGSGGDTGW